MRDKTPKAKALKRSFRFKNTCGDGQEIKVHKNSYEDGILFSGLCGISKQNWKLLVEWVEQGGTKSE